MTSTSRHLLALAAIALAFGGSAVQAQETESAIARGGRLYDKFYGENKAAKPTADHPSYIKDGKYGKENSWRCKECHGWDYKGKDGAYARGSRFTGIKGLRDVAGAPPERIASIIRDKTHGYTEAMIPDRAVAALALFVSKGQIDVEPTIDRASKKANGDPKRGARYYQTICAVCHGFDGKQINFQTPEDPEFIGTVANDNPWETLHKIRHGQPGIPMPSLGVLELKDLVDILAYTQTLPKK